MKEHLLWDYAAGKVVLRWKPQLQKVEHSLEIGVVRRPWVFAVSPTGKYLAEGGDGMVRISEVVR